MEVSSERAACAQQSVSPVSSRWSCRRRRTLHRRSQSHAESESELPQYPYCGRRAWWPECVGRGLSGVEHRHQADARRTLGRDELDGRPEPKRITRFNRLIGVANVPGSKKSWAVGDGWSNGPYLAQIVEWQGSFWQTVAAPTPGTQSDLYGVDARSTSDAWAVGEYIDGGARKTLIEHWDGSTWSQVPSPSPSTTWNVLKSVSVVSATDVWAVGFWQDATSFTSCHWSNTGMDPNGRSSPHRIWPRDPRELTGYQNCVQSRSAARAPARAPLRPGDTGRVRHRAGCLGRHLPSRLPLLRQIEGARSASRCCSPWHSSRC